MPPALFIGIGASVALAGVLSSIAVSIAITVVTTVVGMLLQRKPKKNPLVMDDRTITVRQPLTPRQVIYGASRVGGTIVFLERLTGDDILLGIVWAGHEIEAIDSVYADDEQLFVNGDGSVLAPRFDEIQIHHHLGSDDQEVDEAFQTLAPKLWTDDHRLRGRAWSAIVIYNLASNWDNNIPNFSASVRGKKLYDPRTNTTQYSTNSALCILDFLTDERYGYGKRIKLEDIDLGNFAAEANICDEEVSVTQWEDSFTVEDTKTVTFSAAGNTIIYGSGGPRTGESVYLTTTGTLPAPLVAGTEYFIRATWTDIGVASTWVRKLYPTLADAEADTNLIDLTTAGSGVHTAIPNNTRITLTGATMGFSGNAATNVIDPDEAVWTPEFGGGDPRAVIIMETTGAFAAEIVEGTKYKWQPTSHLIFDYPNGVASINYSAGSTGTFSMRFISYGVDVSAAEVDASADTIDFSTSGGVIGPVYNGMPLVVRGPGTVPTPLVDGDTYFAVLVPGSTQLIRLALSKADAAIGRYIDLQDTGADTWFIETGELTQREISGMTTGMACQVYESVFLALPAPLVDGETYYIIRTGHSSFSLATSRANAYAGIAVTITSLGSGAAANIRLLNEQRYTSNGVYDADQDKGDVIRGLLSACAGKLLSPVGNDKWKLAVGAYRLPLIDLDEGDAIGGITLQARRPRRETCNTVKGTFAGPVNFDQPASLPVVTNANYIAEDDDEELAIEMNLPFTESKFMGQRILKIELERRRKQMAVSITVPIEIGLQIEPTDGIDFSWARFDLTDRNFECSEWEFSVEGGGENEMPTPRIKLELIEMGPDVYE